MMTKALLLAVTLVACGGGNEGEPAKAPTGSTSAAAAAGGADCVAGFVGETPAGWVPAGKLVVTMDGDNPKHVAAFDAAGKRTMSADVPADHTAGKDVVSKAICSAGGLDALAPKDKNAGGDVTLALVEPTSTDPAADVALMCKGAPADIPADFDPSQKMRVAAVVFATQVASSKWRTWMNTIDKELSTAGDAQAAMAIKSKHAAELDAAATTKPCWFADALRGKL